MITDHLGVTLAVGGESLRITPAAPIEAAELGAAERRIGWPLPEDYRACLTTLGAADVFGARLLAPAEGMARGEPLAWVDLVAAMLRARARG